MSREDALETAAKILAEHFPYQIGARGRDASGECKALQAIADAIVAAAKH